LGPGSPHNRRRRLLAALLLAALAALVLPAAAAADWLTPESGGSPNADDIDTLYKIILGVAIVVFVIVEGALLYSLFKFRARKGYVPAQIRGNTNLEISWTVAAALILVVLATITFIMLPGIINPPNTGADGLNAGSGALYASVDKPTPPNGRSLVIGVNGRQYIWRYEYPNNVYAYQEMVVPVNTTVVLRIRAQDVVHSWWIPKLGGKKDAVPGNTNWTWFKIPKEGVYDGQCAELCGRNHANMLARVRAVSVAEYEDWVAQQRQDIESANEAAAREREQFNPLNPRNLEGGQ